MEEFRDHWFNQHGKIFSSLAIVKKNVLKYEQVSLALFVSPLIPVAHRGTTRSSTWRQARLTRSVQ